jgi:outer membrane protein OmpA-like peptidoglycan-associated protein
MANQDSSEKKRSALWTIFPAVAIVLFIFYKANDNAAPPKPILSGEMGKDVKKEVKTVEHTPEVHAETTPAGMVEVKLPDGKALSGAVNGIESRLVHYIQDPASKMEKTDWIDFDNITFASGSHTLEATSMNQLTNLSEILKAFPNVKLKIGGYTDNVGDPKKNMALSTQRAEGIVTELVKMGIAADRLKAEGYGDTVPLADNSTEKGRAKNRRMSVRVTGR